MVPARSNDFTRSSEGREIAERARVPAWSPLRDLRTFSRVCVQTYLLLLIRTRKRYRSGFCNDGEEGTCTRMPHACVTGDHDDGREYGTISVTRVRRHRNTRERIAQTHMRTRASPEDGREKKNEKIGKAAEPQSEAPTSCGKNGHGAIMFLLGFISKRVINYTSKYNDDDEGHDDIHYSIYIHIHMVYVYIRRSMIYELSQPSFILSL